MKGLTDLTHLVVITNQAGVGVRKIKALFRQEAQYCWASELSNMRVLGLELGTFRDIHRPEAPSAVRGVLESRTSKGQAGGSAQGEEPD